MCSRNIAAEMVVSTCFTACTKSGAFVRAGRMCLILGAFLSLLTGHSLAQNTPSEENMEIFVEPPEPEQLRRILFPTRSRSIVINDDVKVKKAEPRVLGMQINFEFGSTTIVRQSLPLLDSIGEMLKLESVENEAIIIEGHTDSVGGDEFNQKLSEERALAIRRYLVSIHNIRPDRLHPIGKGERELHNTKNPKAPTNRRVQFKPLLRRQVWGQ